jgi:hypothetical protein
MSLGVGTIVRLKVPCLGNDAGARGYVFNNYGDGCQVIFPNGEYDGFGDRPDSEEVNVFLDVVGKSDLPYNFTNVMRLSRDFDNHYFKEVFE